MKNTKPRMLKTKTSIFLVFFIFCFNTVAKSEAFEGRVINYIRGKPLLVRIALPQETHLQMGSTLEVFRIKSGTLVPTGLIKLLTLTSKEAVAQVIDQSSEYSRALCPDYPDIMAGDLVKKPQMIIHRNHEITPIAELEFRHLFSNPSTNPESFELSQKGIELLERVALEFSNRRFSRLIIKGFTDDQGDAAINQVESFQRATTVRQYLVDKLNFSPDRLIALGFGEDNLKDISHTEGSIARNRRIEISIAPNYDLQ